MRPVMFVCASVSVTMTALPISAQDHPADSGTTTRTDEPEEIIVTARRRPERIQGVSVAASVNSGSTLDALQINNPTGLVAPVRASLLLDATRPCIALRRNPTRA